MEEKCKERTEIISFFIARRLIFCKLSGLDNTAARDALESSQDGVRRSG